MKNLKKFFIIGRYIYRRPFDLLVGMGALPVLRKAVSGGIKTHGYLICSIVKNISHERRSLTDLNLFNYC